VHIFEATPDVEVARYKNLVLNRGKIQISIFIYRAAHRRFASIYFIVFFLLQLKLVVIIIVDFVLVYATLVAPA